MGFLLGLPLRLLGLIFGLIRFLIPLMLLVQIALFFFLVKADFSISI